MLVSGGPEKELVTSTKHSSDERSGNAFEHEELKSEAGYAMKLVTFKLLGSKKPSHGLEPSK